MKYIENQELSRLAQALSYDGECAVHTRIEAYSCKNVKRDKKLFRALEHAYTDDLSASPPLPSWLALDHEAAMTPFGPIDSHAARKTLFLLIATLNIAFPDHEFSDVRPAHFTKEPSGAAVLNALSTTLIAPHRAGLSAPRTYSSYPPTSPDFFPDSVPTSSSPYSHVRPSPYAPPPIVAGTHPTLYRILDDAIGLAECEVFSYAPDIDSDPHADADDAGSDADADSDSSSTDSDGATFAFDDYDIDEAQPPPHPRARSPEPAPPRRAYVAPGRLRPRGALLWSSHWFFLNRKRKRVLFISVWARSRGVGRAWAEDAAGAAAEKHAGERFLGWEGAVGAGARALGLRAAA